MSIRSTGPEDKFVLNLWAARDPKDRDSLNHVQANLLKGMEENYAWLGQHWPDNRYVAIGLSFDAHGSRADAAFMI